MTFRFPNLLTHSKQYAGHPKYNGKFGAGKRTAVFGGPGSGKTTCKAVDLRNESGDLYVLDPQESLSLKVSEFSTLPYIRIADHPSPSSPFINIPLTDNEEANRQARLLFKRCAISHRADVTTSGNPLINETVGVGTAAIQFSGAFPHALQYCFMPWTPEFDAIMERCSDPQTLNRLAHWKRFSIHQQRSELGAGLRITEPFCYDPAYKRLNGFNELLACIISGKGVDYDTVRIIFLFAMYTLLQRFEKETVNAHLVIDEAETYQLITDELIRWMLTLRKQGVSITVICHAMGFDEIRIRQLLQAADRIEIFRSFGEAAHMLAKEIATANFNPYAVHHEDVRDRQRRASDGEYEDFTETTTHYSNFDQQIHETARRIMQLKVGQRYVVENGRAWIEQVALPKDPWNVGPIRAKGRAGRWSRTN